MKMLFLTNSYPPPLEGGSRVYIYNIVSNLPSSQVLVYTNARPNHNTFDVTQTYPIIRSKLLAGDFEKMEKVRMWRAWFVRLAPLLLRENIDVFHVNDLIYVGPVAWFLSRLFKKPYILYLFAEELNRPLRQAKSMLSRLRMGVFSRLIRDAAGYVVVSDFTASLLERFGADRQKMIKILPMVEPAKSVSSGKLKEIRVKYKIRDEARVILCAGRLVERKGQDFLIRAIPRVLAAFPNTLLIIGGRGPDGDRLHRLVDEVGIQKQTVFTGFLEEDELNALYEMCEVFVMPHRETKTGDTEGCPTVFLEANAHGKPVVGGKAGGVYDAILDGETGFIVDGEQPDQIANKVIQLLDDKELAGRFGETGRQRVLEELSPKQGADRILAFSNRILEIATR